ncbi:MAG TPA: hypothetical protein VF723_13025 [Pyrinomonadaceae bacterium]|jgi:hypothetical protein
MARGWESKAVEAQIEEAGAGALEQPRDALSPEERVRHDRLESLRLSRARTLDQLERATRPAHRSMLQGTLRAIEAEIEELGQREPPSAG